MQIELVVDKKSVKELKRAFKDLIPIYPDILFYVFGTISNAVGIPLSLQFTPNTCCVKLIGRPLEACVEPSISGILYKAETHGTPPKISAANVCLTFSFIHSNQQIDRAFDKAEEALWMAFEEVQASFRKKALGGEKLAPSFIKLVCLGATSLAYSFKFERKLMDYAPNASYTAVYQINDLPNIAKEERQRRVATMIRELTNKGRRISFLVEYDGTMEFNDNLLDFLGFLIELQAEYRNYLKSKAASPSLDQEFETLYDQGLILLASTVHRRPVGLDDIKWLVGPAILESFKSELKNRVFIVGLFSSIDMLNSVKETLGGNVRAAAVRSSKWERKYVVGLKISEEEAKSILRRVCNL
jgi:hypothetical protein